MRFPHSPCFAFQDARHTGRANWPRVHLLELQMPLSNQERPHLPGSQSLSNQEPTSLGRYCEFQDGRSGSFSAEGGRHG